MSPLYHKVWVARMSNLFYQVLSSSFYQVCTYMSLTALHQNNCWSKMRNLVPSNELFINCQCHDNIYSFQIANLLITHHSILCKQSSTIRGCESDLQTIPLTGFHFWKMTVPHRTIVLPDFISQNPSIVSWLCQLCPWHFPTTILCLQNIIISRINAGMMKAVTVSIKQKLIFVLLPAGRHWK